MRGAKIENGVVVNLWIVPSLTAFEGIDLILAPNEVLVGWSYNGLDFIAPEPPPTPIPKVVTMRQARLALLQQGLLASIQPAIDALDEPHRSGANIEWEYSQEVERNRPFVELLSQALELTDDDLDALFELAATL